VLDVLSWVAEVLDLSNVDEPGHLAMYVALTDEVGELEVGMRWLHPDLHPTVELAGLVAPRSWWAFGLSTTGRAHFLDEPDRAPERIVSTYVRERNGCEVSLLRRGSSVTELNGPAEGRIPDLVRSILGVTP
jgi:hypothetical protein